MNLDDIPLFSILKSRLGYLAARQKLIAENVANTATPGYSPRDLKPFSLPTRAVAAMGGGGGVTLAPVQTSGAHMTTAGGGGTGPEGGENPTKGWQDLKSPDSETRLDGNAVVLEEEMVKMTDSRMNYDTAIGFYEKSLAMLQLAIRTPGKGA